MIRRKFFLAVVSASVIGITRCGKNNSVNSGAELQPPEADILLTGIEQEDIKEVGSSDVQTKIQAIAQGSGEELKIAAKTTQGEWETISFKCAPENTGGASYMHPLLSIGDQKQMHVSVNWAGGIVFGLGKTIALQFRDEQGRLLGENGEVTNDPAQAMSWSVLTGSHAAAEDDLIASNPSAGKLVSGLSSQSAKSTSQEDVGTGLASNITRIFGIALGAVIALTVLKWIIGLVAFLAMQFFLFLAAAAAIGAIAFLLNSLFGISVTDADGRSRLVDFFKSLFAKLIQAAKQVFDSIKNFLNRVDFQADWPPQIPEDGFNNLVIPG
jgi:hypothetical protein